MPTLPSLRSLRAQTQEGPTSYHIMTLTRGGLGNILFQWLATEAQALSLAPTPTVTSYLSGTLDKRPDITAYEMFSNVATFEKLDIPRNAEYYVEPTFLHKPIAFPKIATQVLDGYFQSWKFFEPHRRELVAKLRSNGGTALASANAWLEKARYEHWGKRLVGIHVRQGDYLSPENKEKHYICDGAYWERALRTAIAAGILKDPETEVFVIASDDPAAVRLMHAFKGLQAAGYEMIWLPADQSTETTERTFWTLAGLDTLLISNSSFSLGAWYCRDRDTQLVAPARWFGQKGPAFRIGDIVPQDTLLIGDSV
jgi:hypothetical protein